MPCADRHILYIEALMRHLLPYGKTDTHSCIPEHRNRLLCRHYYALSGVLLHLSAIFRSHLVRIEQYHKIQRNSGKSGESLSKHS